MKAEWSDDDIRHLAIDGGFFTPARTPLMVGASEARPSSATGTETADVHLARFRQRSAVLHDLKRRPSHWLQKAAKAFAKAVERDWNNYRA